MKLTKTPPDQFGRIYQLHVGDAENGLFIDSLQITFDINKKTDNSKSPNSAAIEIYNLSRDSLAILERDFIHCKFSVGYKTTGLKQLYSGQVKVVTTKQSGADVVTQLLLGTGYVELNHSTISRVIPAGKTVADAIEELRQSIPGIARGIYKGTAIQSQVIYGYTMSASAREILDDLAASNDFEWRLDDGVLYVNDHDKVIEKDTFGAFVLNHASGLIEAPFFATSTRKRSGLQFKALLNPLIKPGSVVRVEHSAFEGFVKVDSARYYGGFRSNEWYVECFCSEYKTD